MNWTQFYTGILPLLGVIVGGTVTYFTQNSTIKKQHRREREKANLEFKIELLNVYNEVLKIDGEKEMQFISGGIEFNYEVYRKKIRPLLYSKYHLLHLDVAQCVRAIDNKIGESVFYNDFERSNTDYIVSKYNEMIERIEKHIATSRALNFIEITF